MLSTGVYIGSDLEMVVTDKYVITYRRNKQADLLESQLFQKRGQTYFCIGICQSSPTETEQYKPPMCWKKAFLCNGEILADCQVFQQGQELRYDRPPIYEAVAEQQLQHSIGLPFDVSLDAEQAVVPFPDGTTYPVVLDERFTDETLRPALPSICDDNIGTCLKLWNMGVYEEYIEIDGKPTFIGVTVNTDKHMYIFELAPHSIYCRAARFVATNQGVVFHQNFRQGFEAYMIEDNAEARNPLPFDASLFSKESCMWNDRSVYWSVDSYNDTEITLHGCQGELYHWTKPDR